MRRWVLGLFLAGSWALAQADTKVSVQVSDAQGQPLAGAVVALEQPGLPRRAGQGPSAPLAQMAQQGWQFTPRLLVVQTGTAVAFPNQDKVRHHVYSYSPAKSFELKLYLGDEHKPERFDKAGVVPLGCNLHDAMSAHIVVVDTPVFGITDATGQVQLERRAGPGLLRFWHASQLKPELQSQALGSEPLQRLVLKP